jgi:hypothetical protein
MVLYEDDLPSMPKLYAKLQKVKQLNTMYDNNNLA